KSESLRLAKLKYLEESHDNEPYYWGGLVALGDMENNQYNSSLNLRLLLALLIITGASVFYVKIRKRGGEKSISP
ncbi:MAG: hypothetical protein AAGC85_08960, partial [Bacteroidota bacterium]